MGALNNYAEENKYTRFSKFKSIKEFNNHFDQSMWFHKDKFTKSEYAALKKLRNFAYSDKSLNTIGVAWSRVKNMVSATHDDSMFGVSRSTFHRMLRKAKKLNLITVINQFNKNKYKKHNVYAFNRFEELTPQNFEIVSESHTIDTSEDVNFDTTIPILLELPRLKELKTYPQAEKVDVDKDLEKSLETKDTPYHQVRKMIQGLLPEKNAVSRIYGIWLAQSKHSGFEVDFEIARIAVKKLILEIKRRKSLDLIALQNPYGYFSGILRNLIAKQAELNIEEIEELDWFKGLKHKNKIASVENGRVVRKAPKEMDKAFLRQQLGLSEPSIDFEAERIRLLKELGYDI